MQKQRRELGLKRFWSAVKTSNSSSSQGDHDSPHHDCKPGPNCSLPLLQVWPSSDSPRGEADGQSFVFPECTDDNISQHSTCLDAVNHTDSGIDSTQVSPLPPVATTSPITSPTPSVRRPSSTLLHPDHARLFRMYPVSSPEQTSMEDISDQQNNPVLSPSSSTTSSLTSVAAAGEYMNYHIFSGVVAGNSVAGNSLASNSTDSRRRSSTMTARYSLFDALDLEYALLRAAARGSVGPYSLSESLHKLTFTQSLAFPALARGLAGKRRRSQQNNNSRPLDPSDSGLNAFAKVITVLVLVLVSVLVFAVVYKFVRT
ncbi:uncharacterized protein LOC143192721 isoform X1 [Rhynchophorus ferrugineus]|uniref:uncharacterized protein LOC143192721 isoform X1 n=1 Tax=Rhynchophorus ferrugineus TaxID=354439 RepID=UPI003FCC3251